ncbi:cell division protein FtsQ/DivIB [Balneolales bacterium ANBcel1]|nr:cell division protein FtsQ/DivIB [Balneolales bacterium ANBcel1]
MTRSIEKQSFGIEYLFAAAALIIAAVVIGWQLNRSVMVSEITVHGHLLADADGVLYKSGIDEGMHGDSIVFLDVIERIETLPWIRTAHVNLSQTGRMRIRVEEERPIALLVDNGRSALVAESGIVLPVVLGRQVDVPILHGFSLDGMLADATRPDTLASESFEMARSFLARAASYPGLYAMISEVMVTGQDGVVALTDENTVRLTFGHEDFDRRLRKWQAFQSQVISQKGIDHVRTLDFRYSGQIVARER